MTGLNSLQVRIGHFLGVDRGVFFAIAGKMWGMGAGLLTTLLIASFFTPELQGYYYTFFSVLALQIFAELGLGIVIGSHASHEWAKLAFNQDGRVEGDGEALSKLIGLGRFAFRWYAAAGVIVTIALLFGGFAFFGATGWHKMSVWGAPWTLLCVMTGVNLCCMPIWALLEGCNQVANVYRYRLIQSVISALAAWLAIYLGAGLWVCALMGVMTFITMLMTMVHRYHRFIRQVMFGSAGGKLLNWRADILPMQWRISLSWMSGYFAFSLFTPVLFHFQGPVVAGQMGMTWTLIAALTAVASSWVVPKAPAFGMLIAQHKYEELDRMFWRLTKIVACVTTVGALVIWGGVYVLVALGHPFAQRLLSPSAVAQLLVATLLQAVSLPMATYLRAHKREPLLVVSVTTGLITGVVVVVAGRFYSAEGVAIGYLFVMVVATPFVGLVWQRCRKEWHAGH
jgi:O-antigen/teichoic acid export membrane protein